LRDSRHVGYLGDVFKITVESDGDKGIKWSHPEWKPETFVLEDDQSGKFTFTCDKWFSKKKDGQFSFLPYSKLVARRSQATLAGLGSYYATSLRGMRYHATSLRGMRYHAT
jgi:hypothetical protein